jgi:heme/copper-type cytochrome/quinol oxidase subunit 4
LEEYLKFPSQNKSADGWFIFAVLVGLLVVAIILVAIPVILIRLLWQSLIGG